MAAFLLVPATAQAHLSKDDYIEKTLHQAFEVLDETAVLELLPRLTTEAIAEWNRIDEAQIVAVEAPASNGSSNHFVDPWGCEADELHEYDNPPYYGKYQFDRPTWYAHGGGPCYDSRSCTEAEQDRVAANVTYDAWPNC